jgi:hypothetical protein
MKIAHALVAAVTLAGTFALAPVCLSDPAATKVAAPAAAPAAPKPTVALALSENAPEIEATNLKGDAVTLESLTGKPVVLQFGSITDPIFRGRVEDSEKLAAKFGDKATFLIVYQHEAHAADGPDALEVNASAAFAITKPVNQSERLKLAAEAAKRLKIKNQQLLVDAWSDASSLRYGNYPNMTFVIDSTGKLQAGYPWMDPTKVTGALNALLAGKPVPPQFRGRTAAGTPGASDIASQAQGMGGYRGANLALVLDHMTLTPQQKAAIYPPLGEYLVEVRDFREKHGAGLAAAGARRPGAQPETAGATGTANGAAADTEKAESPEDFQKAVENLRAAAQKLKTAVNAALPEKEAKQVMDALEQGPAKRIFAD